MKREFLGVEHYPTPIKAALRLINMVYKKSGENGSSRSFKSVLDPSAGTGDLLYAFKFAQSLPVEALNLSRSCAESAMWIKEDVALQLWKDDIHRRPDQNRKQLFLNLNIIGTFAVEIDPSLQAILRSKGVYVVGDDWLTFNGSEQMDLILMNPPFSEGEHHLLRALDYMYSGVIGCVLNAETIRNPYSQARKDLIERLNKLGATVEFHTDLFNDWDSQRKTDVEVALITVAINRDIDEDLFDGQYDEISDPSNAPISERGTEMVTADPVGSAVQRYETIKEQGIQLILDFWRDSKGIDGIELEVAGVSKIQTKGEASRTQKVKLQTNAFLHHIRGQAWLNLLKAPAFAKYLTSQKKAQYEKKLQERSRMDFTQRNIRNFLAEISAGFQDDLTESILAMYDEFTYVHSYCRNIHAKDKNKVHYHNAWVTNNCFKVAKKVIHPLRLTDSWGRLEVPYDCGFLDDLDKVFTYFNGGVAQSVDSKTALSNAFKDNISTDIQTDWFSFTVYQKGTVHIKFLSEDLLRRFNIFCAAQRKELPMDYGIKPAEDLSELEKELASEFETGGLKKYKVDFLCQPVALPKSNSLGQSNQMDCLFLEGGSLT